MHHIGAGAAQTFLDSMSYGVTFKPFNPKNLNHALIVRNTAVRKRSCDLTISRSIFAAITTWSLGRDRTTHPLKSHLQSGRHVFNVPTSPAHLMAGGLHSLTNN